MAGPRKGSGSGARARVGLLAVVLGALAPVSVASGAVGWPAAETISEAGANVVAPRVDVSASGEAVAVWSVFDASGFRAVRAAVRPAGGAWAAPETLAVFAEAESGAGEADVALDLEGNAVAAWTRAGVGVQAAFRPAGGGWAVETIGPGGGGPHVAFSSNGDAMVAWTDGIPAAVTATRPAGGAWGAPEPVGPGRDPRVALDAAGNAVAVWTRVQVSLTPLAFVNSGVMAAVRPAGGPWGPATTLSAVGDDPDARVALGVTGNAVLVWEGAGGLTATVRPAGGDFGEPTVLSATGTDPEVGIDGSGTAVAVWQRPVFRADPHTGEVTSIPRIESAVRPAGEPWGAPEAFPAGVGDGTESAVAVGPGGNAAAVWTGAGGSAGTIGAALRPYGGPWRAPETISAAGQIAADPDVALAGATEPVAVWRRTEDGTPFGFRVQAATHDATPALPPPAAGTPICLPVPAPPEPGGRAAPVRVSLTLAQLRINQRIGQAAMRRLNAVEAWLAAGIEGRDLCGGAVGAAKLGGGIGAELGAANAVGPPDPRPVEVAPAAERGGAVRLTPAQLRINQRISQAAIRRAAALEARLAGRLTGGDIKPGALTRDELAPAMRITGVPPASSEPAPSRTEVAPRPPGDGRIVLSAAQLRVNQRVAQAAVRRANALVARLEAGLTGDAFADASITARNLTPGVARPLTGAG